MAKWRFLNMQADPSFFAILLRDSSLSMQGTALHACGGLE
jgi:hypothetical protein